MRSIKQEITTFSQPADAVFQAALGVLQNDKRATLLAAHNTGRLLFARQKSAMSNPKLLKLVVEGDTTSAQMNVMVGTDSRTREAILDGRANEKALVAFIQDVQGALDGTKSAPATPVPDHFMQKKTQVPWTDPTQDPEIEIGGGFIAHYGF